MKKISLLILIILLCALVMMVNASIIPDATFTASPKYCTLPNCRITYTITYGCTDSDFPYPQSLMVCPSDWDLWMSWDPNSMKFVSFDGWTPTSPGGPDCLHYQFFGGSESSTFWCAGADYDGLRYLVLDIKDTTPATTQLTTTLEADYGVNSEGALGSSFTLIQTTSVVSANTPEFPSPYLPAITIIGFLGVVFYIKRTREH
jgi:hypothetical protein